ncbi:MAG TPA: hypothetical protein VL326_18300 [Kofleriaceae bacterium]|nr:hypothetical protein [Kofleriaceae bacterium]
MTRALVLMMVVAACASPSAPPPPSCACSDGKICEGDRCVDPWRYGSPTFSTCPAEPRATPESLAEKAALYDARAIALHTHPKLPWVMDVAIAPDVDPESATAADVTVWRSGENDGLFSGLVLAAEAYRYAVTHEPAARDALALLLRGEQQRMAITGVPGLFTRQLIPPGVPNLACPTDPAVYMPSPDKRGNRWVQIGADGCAQTADATGAFVSTSHCGLTDFAGWCFLDNVSQDEYAGHIFALGAIVRVVDDPALHDIAASMLRQIGEHLRANNMQLVDWDGRPTQWGKLYPGAPGGDSPGYLAVLGASAIANAAVADASLEPFAHDTLATFAASLDQIELWQGPDGCESNWNDISMLLAAFHHVLWSRDDVAPYRDAFTAVMTAAPNTRGPLVEHNAWYDIMWAAQKPLGPSTDGPAYAAVEDAVCQLRQFPRSNHLAAHDTSQLAPHACDDRFQRSLAATPFPIADRCAATFAWWGNPYERTSCSDEPTLVQQPAGYLLPYWMGRYYGFISARQ